jgi:hypothetical protein
MLNRDGFPTSIRQWVAATILILLFCAGLTTAQTGSASSSRANYTFLVASGFLCDSGDSGTCPAVARSANGDSYEISGAGTFDPGNKSAKAAGTFNHKSANGDMLETGVWTAIDFISFGSYGVAPAALMRKGPALGRPQFDPRHLPMRSGPLPTGGLAVFRILLMPVSGMTKTALLQVNCALGDVPRERSVGGIRVTLERDNSEYLEEANGRVMFLALRPEPNTLPKMRDQEARPEAPEQLQK